MVEFNEPMVCTTNGDTTAFKATAKGTGVWGESKTWMGVFGYSESTSGGHGVKGEAVGTGVAGVGKTWLGVYGETQAPANAGAAGVWGDGKNGGDGVKGLANGPGKAAVAGFHLSNTGPGVFGKGKPAGRFEGDVEVTGNLTVQNTDLLARITQLEGRVTALESMVGDLQQTVAGLLTLSHPQGSG
ncbi:hypothetical protein ACFVWY_22930 [Streptomyces sp. NPDC058195]|uniref:hypothetical protein n=1 Tax=Streptomyces sp. NPDC058195 TaxID=3346375 RepID=UPI0036E4B54B